MRTLLNADFGNIKSSYLFQDYTVNINIYTARLCKEEGDLILRYIPPTESFQYSIQRDLPLPQIVNAFHPPKKIFFSDPYQCLAFQE